MRANPENPRQVAEARAAEAAAGLPDAPLPPMKDGSLCSVMRIVILGEPGLSRGAEASDQYLKAISIL